MAKKDLMQGMAKGLGSLLQPTTPQTTEQTNEQPRLVAAGVRKSPQGRKAVAKKEYTTSVKTGLQDGYIRATVIARIEYIDKMKEIAYQNRSSLKEQLEQAMGEYIAAWEAQYGEITL